MINLFGEEETATKLIDRDVLAGILYNMLSQCSIEEFVALIINKQEAALEFARLCSGERAGKNISLLFNPHRMDTACLGSKTSIYAALKDERFCSGLARAVIDRDRKNNREVFYQAVILGVNGIAIPHEFQPTAARDIYLRSSPHGVSLRVLDPCAGWGGRMIGAASVGAYYEAWEPSTRTYSGLLKLGEWLKQFKTGFDFVVHHEPFEGSAIPPRTFDVALTSPPYYDTERYSDEESNSFNRYPNFTAWVSGFYHPMIHKTMKALRPGAEFVLNVGDRKYPLSDALKDTGYSVCETATLLGGISGLGRKSGEGEKFYRVTTDTP